MKKRRKSHNSQPQPPDNTGAASPTEGAGLEPEQQAELEALQGDDAELDLAGDNETTESVEEPAEISVEAAPELIEEAKSEEATADFGEPMEELLAELLALDLDAGPAVAAPVEAEELLAAPEAVAASTVPEPEAFAEPLIETPLEDVTFEPDTLEPALLEAAREALIEEPQELLSAEATPLEAEEPSSQAAQLLREESPAVFDEPALLDQSTWVEVPSFDTAEMSPEPEEIFEPLPPQPSLEAVVGSIDRALESAPAVVAPVEAAPTHHKQFSQLDDYIVFSLSGSDYAVPVRDVAEIGRIPGVTRVPNVPDFVRGITNLRGEVVPVLNLPLLLGLQDSAPSARGRIVFLQARDLISPTGLIVDEVKGIQRIQSQQLEQVTGLVDDKVTSVLRGVHGRGERLLNVLDLEQLFQLEEVRELAIR